MVVFRGKTSTLFLRILKIPDGGKTVDLFDSKIIVVASNYSD